MKKKEKDAEFKKGKKPSFACGYHKKAGKFRVKGPGDGRVDGRSKRSSKGGGPFWNGGKNTPHKKITWKGDVKVRIKLKREGWRRRDRRLEEKSGWARLVDSGRKNYFYRGAKKVRAWGAQVI